MISKRQLLRQQRRWARGRGLVVYERGYFENIEANLRVPLSPPALRAFSEGGGSELLGRGGGRPKMCALHSSSALAVNFFDHWTPESAAPLLQALGIEGALESPPRFEAQLPTGLPGTPPNLEVALTLTSGTVLGIECKFTEWMTPKRASRPAFKDKYFGAGGELWTRNGLPRCQALAVDLMDGADSFRHLDAAQLLKHALGLATQHRDRLALCYLYYDPPCAVSALHASEIARFRERVDVELGFVAATYQGVYRRLRAAPGVDAEYLEYLGSRYLPLDVRPAV